MNQINPKKLANSKWTAVKPGNKEKHFLVTAVEFDEEGTMLVSSTLEVMLSKNEYLIDWVELKDSEHWVQGWK